MQPAPKELVGECTVVNNGRSTMDPREADILNKSYAGIKWEIFLLGVMQNVLRLLGLSRSLIFIEINRNYTMTLRIEIQEDCNHLSSSHFYIL